ncbi:MAG: AbrB/MazE/SpoVT family DNA-binding domain-containing protein [Salaquimonas sp.]|nr:AbrB/MazE/SpoVT family DNA-binding domain-containing protein [Salaquimonas sp.]
MGAFTTMTSKGQLTIPKDVREALKLTPGTRFYVTERDGEVVALPKNKSIADLAGMLGDPPGGPATLGEIDEAIARHVAEDDERISREWHERREKFE